MKTTSLTSASKRLHRLAICSVQVYAAITAHALTVNGTTTLGGGGTTTDTNVVVGTTTANSQLNIGDHTVNVSDQIRIGAGGGLGGSVVQTGGLVNYTQTIGTPGYNTSQFLIGHWNGGTNAANYNISAGELRVINANTIVGWDGTGNLNVSGTALVNVQELTVQQANGAAGPSTLNVSGGTVNTTYLNMGVQRGAGTVEQSGGTINVTGGNGIRVGHWGAGANSSYTMTGGQLNSTKINVGWDGANSSFNASGSSDINISGAIEVQRASTLTIGGNTDLDVTGNLVFGGGRGSGTGFFEGNATIDANNLIIQNDSNLTLRGTSTTTVNTVIVGDGWGNNTAPHPTLTIAGGATLNAKEFSIGDAGSRAGSVVQTGGTVNVAEDFRLGHWGGNTSNYDISGGTLNLTGTNGGFENTGALTLGVDGTGIFNQSGGLVVAESLRLDSRGATAGVDQYNMTGGTLALRAGGIAGNGDTSTYAVNLGGGTLRADENFTIATPVTLTGTGGDTTFDTNGNTIYTNQVLSGPGGLITTGGGTLELAGRSSFTGGLTVGDGSTASTVILSGGGWYVNPSQGTGMMTVNDGSTVVNWNAHSFGGRYNPNVDMTLNGGTFQIRSSTYVDDIWMTGGTIEDYTGFDSGMRTRGYGGTVITVQDSATQSVISSKYSTSQGTSTITVNDPDTDFLISGNVIGNKAITKNGVGTLLLTGDNSGFSGGFEVKGGTLKVDSIADRVGTGYLALKNGTLEYTGTGAETATNLLWIDAGGQSGTFDITNAAANLTLDPAGGNVNQTVIKTGAGTLTMLGALNGSTDVQTGTLRIGNGGTSGSATGNITIAAGARMEFNRSDDFAINGNSQTVTGPGLLVQNGTGTITFNHNWVVGAMTADLEVNNGTVRLDGGFGNGGTRANQINNAVVNNGGTLVINTGRWQADGTAPVNLTINTGGMAYWDTAHPWGWWGRGEMHIDGGTMDLRNSGGEGPRLQMTGGTLMSSGNQTFRSNNTITINASPNTSVISANVRLDGNRTIAVADGSNNTDLLISGVISQSGGDRRLTKTGDGRAVLSGNNTYAGGTTISAGILQIGNGGTSGTLGTGAVTNNSALVFDRSDTHTVDNEISGTGTLTKNGPGTTNLTGANTYSGKTTINTGTLKLDTNASIANSIEISVQSGATFDVSAVNGGFKLENNQTMSGTGMIDGPMEMLAGSILSPGNSPGTLTMNSALMMFTGSTLDLELNGGDQTIGGGINDLVTGVTDLTLDGIIDVSETTAFLGNVERLDRWVVIEYTGDLTDNGIALGSTPTMQPWMSLRIDLSVAGQVALVAVPEPSSALLIVLGGIGFVFRRRK